MASPDSRYQIPGLQRGLRVLEYLGAQCDGATAAEIAEALRFPKNSVYRITITLREAGFAEQDEGTGRWSLSQKVAGLGFAALSDRRLLDEARAELIALRNASKETIVLCLLHDTVAVIVDEVPGLHAFRFVVTPGYRTPLHASAQGKVFLAYLPEPYREDLLARMAFTPFTQHTISDRDDFRLELARVRERGYATDLGEGYEGVHCVSAPVFDYRGDVVAAITVTGPSDRLRPEDGEHLGELVRTHASRVSQRLGHLQVPSRAASADTRKRGRKAAVRRPKSAGESPTDPVS